MFKNSKAIMRYRLRNQ